MIPGTILFALVAIWGGGAAYALGYTAVAYALTALGAGWMGILHSYLVREVSILSRQVKANNINKES